MPSPSPLLVSLACLSLFTVPLAAAAEPVQVSQSSSERQTSEPAVPSIGAEPITLTGSLTADSPTLEDGSHVSIHRFNGEANQVVVIEMMSTDFDAYLLLADPQGNKIAEDDNSAGGNNARIVVKLPTTGTYAIGANSAEAGKTGAYQLRIRTGTAQELAEAERSAPESTILSIGAEPVTVTGSLTANSREASDGSYYNVHPFNSQVNQTVVLELNSEDFDAYLLLLDSEGNKIAEDNNSAGGNNARITATLPATGNYVVVVNSSGARETGRYRLSLQTGNASTSAPTNGTRAGGASTSEGAKAEADRLFQQGIEQDKTSQLRAALQSWNQALQIYQQIGDRQGEAYSLGNLGSAYTSLSQYGKAIDFHQKALAIAREIGDRQGEANVLSSLGNAYDSLGQYDKAIDFYQQSLAIAREIGNRQGEAISLGNLGLAYRSLGQYDTAIDFHQQSLVIDHEIGDRQGEATSLGSLGIAYGSLGQYDKAIDFYQQSLAIAREIGDRQGEAISLGNLGLAYRSLGQYDKAIDFLQQVLSIFREIGDRQGEAAALGNLGNTYRSLGQYDKAIDFQQQQLIIDHEIGDRQGESNALGNLGNSYWLLGQYDEAIDFQQQSLAIAREIGYRLGESNALGSLGNSYWLLGQYDEAVDFHQQSLAIDREIDNRQGEAGSLNNLGASLLDLKQFAAATEQLFAAVQVFESMRSTQFSDAEKRSFYDTQAGTFRLLQQSLIAQNDISRALEVSERGRTRAFLELLSSQQSADAASPATPPLPTVAQIQQIAKAENATLVQYSNIFDRFLYIYVVKPTGEIAFRQVPLGDQTDSSSIALLNAPLFRGGAAQPADTVVSGLVNNTRSALRVADATVVVTSTGEDSPDNRLRELHKLLIEPIADLLPTNETDRIIFIPQDSLFLVPFPALKDANGDYLIQHHTVLTAPSIQVLASTQQQRSPLPAKPTDVLVVGNPTMPNIPNISLPNLPGAAAEATTIADFFGTQALTGAAATKAKVVQQMAQAQIIHLATHGLLQYGDPQASGIRDIPGAIALAPSGSDNGLLTSAEIFQMRLKAQLIVLSACDTGRGDITGDGVVGLSRALISAGVPSIIVSLWSVPDAPTSELMAEFYRQWQQNPDKAQALRQAMLTTMQSHPDPRDWAAFTLIGEAESKP